MEGSGFSRLESIHEWCDFEESMILKQDRSRSCSWRIRIGLGRQARRFKSHTQDAAALNEHRHSSKYQECDKKTSQLTGFFLFMLDFLETVLHCHKLHTMQAWSQHKHEIVFLPQGHHPGS